MSYEGRFKLLLDRRKEIDDMKQQKDKKLKQLTKALKEIKFAERKGEIRTLEYNITKLTNELMESIS